jgi:hypothetical protein
MINKFYLNLCDKGEAAQVIEWLKNPRKDKLLTKIMKKQWDSIENDDFQKNLDLNKTQRSHAINTKSKDTSKKEMKECSQISVRWSIGRPFTLMHLLQNINHIFIKLPRFNMNL